MSGFFDSEEIEGFTTSRNHHNIYYHKFASSTTLTDQSLTSKTTRQVNLCNNERSNILSLVLFRLVGIYRVGTVEPVSAAIFNEYAVMLKGWRRISTI
jgi:hypothetical protein